MKVCEVCEGAQNWRVRFLGQLRYMICGECLGWGVDAPVLPATIGPGARHD